MTVRLRPAVAADRTAIRDLHLASWQANYGAELPAAFLRDALPAKMDAKWTARRFEAPEVTLLAEADGAPIGFVCALADRDPPLIDNLHVRPGLQGRGTGARLLRAVLAALAAQGHPRAYLTVLESNPRALAFYLRMGGRDDGPVADQLVGRPVRARRIAFGPDAP